MKRLMIAVAVLAGFAMTANGEAHKTYTDIRYAERRAELTKDEPSCDRILDIHIPNCEKPAKGYPVVVFIHGGGFSGGSKEMSKGLTNLFDGYLNRGYAVVSINYYLTQKFRQKGTKISCSAEMKDGFPQSGKFHPQIEEAIQDACEDASLAMKWIAKNAKKYGLDKSFIALNGGSAGAITCLYTAFVYGPSKPKVKAVVNCWGAVSDLSLISNKNIPVFTIHGDQDALINIDYGRKIDARMQEIGSKGSKMFLMEGRGHAQYKWVGDHLTDEICDFLDAARK